MSKSKTVKIVWNDCDAYIELDVAESRTERKVEGDKLIGRNETHTAIEVVPALWAHVPEDEDGEPNFDGFYLTETGNIYKAA